MIIDLERKYPKKEYSGLRWLIQLTKEAKEKWLPSSRKLKGRKTMKWVKRYKMYKTKGWTLQELIDTLSNQPDQVKYASPTGGRDREVYVRQREQGDIPKDSAVGITGITFHVNCIIIEVGLNSTSWTKG